jgi:activating signal cointegrator 1
VIINAISLTQPWASLVAHGFKRYETRSWSTSYHGPLAIHASKGFPREAIEVCFEQPFSAALREIGLTTPGELPLGQILAVGELIRCARAEVTRLAIDSREAAFGNYTAGRWAWQISNVRLLEQPVPARGSLGLWKWDTDDGELAVFGRGVRS